MLLNELVEVVVESVWQRLLEREIFGTIYQATCYLETTKKENLTEMLTAIRSLKGITVVTMVEPHIAVSEEKQKALINIKFIPTEGIPLKNYLKSLKTSATNVPGVYSLKIKNVETVKTR